MNASKSVTANFGAVKYTLNAVANPAAGGTVSLNPAQPQGGYDPGTVVTLTALANANYSFNNWNGDLTGNTNPATITMNANKNITANLNDDSRMYELRVIIKPVDSGIVDLDPPNPIVGHIITLTARPNVGWIFVNWTGDLTGNTSPATLTMDVNKNVTANFARAPFTSTLKTGWNILSTPIALSMSNNTFDKILDVSQLQIAYRWDASGQPPRWVQVTIADQVKPLEAFYVKVTGDTNTTFVAYEGMSSPPSRNVYEGLNLIGPTPAIDQGMFRETPLNQAFITIEQAAGGLRGYSMVVSPQLNQPGWVFIIGNANVPNLIPYKGYWVVMENPDMLFGFSTTPIP